MIRVAGDVWGARVVRFIRRNRVITVIVVLKVIRIIGIVRVSRVVRLIQIIRVIRVIGTIQEKRTCSSETIHSTVPSIIIPTHVEVFGVGL